MKAHELAEITAKAIAKRNNERPAKLFAELISKMKSQAEAGFDHLDFLFTDPPEVVDAVLDMLKRDDYSINKQPKGVIRIGWDLPSRMMQTWESNCQFDIAWVGRCKKPADKTGFCEEHKQEKCRCGRQGIRSCDATIGPLVCGFVTCGRCTHHH